MLPRLVVVWAMILVTVLPSHARADCQGVVAYTQEFASVGLALALGSRGFTVGVEASAGAFSDGCRDVPLIAYPGIAIGVDVAIDPPRGMPRGRAYVEVEGGIAFFGLGIGPAVLFDADLPTEVHVQATPFAVAPVYGYHCELGDTFVTLALHYRHVFRGSRPAIREGGLLAKTEWLPGRNCAL